MEAQSLARLFLEHSIRKLSLMQEHIESALPKSTNPFCGDGQARVRIQLAI